MEFAGEVIGWFTDPINWSGDDGIPIRIAEHLLLSAVPLLAAVGVGLPLAAWVGHTGRFAGPAVNVSNIGRAVPSLAIMALAAILLSRWLVDIGLRREAGEISTMVAMAALAIPPIITNTYVGISEVERDFVEAARGLGMTATQVLRRVEMPLALPVVLAGVRTAAVQVVATATLGAVFGTGGLGRYIIDGIAQRKYEEVFAGALIVAAMSIATELAFGFVERRSVSAGLKGWPTQARRQP
ncbi:MAG: ABC transporter permease [Chloroflexota bacterium]|nr:ABC transporter permease [Chloroflexota bacterium]